MDGWVYLIRADKYFKIGISKSLHARLAQLSTQPPFDLEMIYAFESQDYHEAERILHSMFKDKRVQGEWFTLQDEDVEFIMEIIRHYSRDFIARYSIATDANGFVFSSKVREHAYRIYGLGCDAARHYNPISTCPFWPGTECYEAWLDGYGDWICNADLDGISFAEIMSSIDKESLLKIMRRRGIDENELKSAFEERHRQNNLLRQRRIDEKVHLYLSQDPFINLTIRNN